MDERQKKMLQVMAHDISSPLNVIVGKTSLIRNQMASGSPNADKINEHLLKIESSVEQITQIIKCLKDE